MLRRSHPARTSVDIDTRSDIYSLGVLPYELLTGSTPFDAKELMAVGLDAMRKAIREQDPPRPSTWLTQAMVAAEATRRTSGGAEESAASRRRLQELVHQLRGEPDWIVMKCLEKDRARRYETANGLAADLKLHLTNEPVLARPPSAAYRFQKACRRNKLVFTAASVTVLPLVLGITVSTWQAIVAKRARDTAQAAQRDEAKERKRADEGEKAAQQHLYVAKMNLIQQAWDQNNMGRMRQLLTETSTNVERGFEWYSWQRMAPSI